MSIPTILFFAFMGVLMAVLAAFGVADAFSETKS